MGLQDFNRNISREVEAELWEYLIAHDEVQDFERWVVKYRQNLEDSIKE